MNLDALPARFNATELFPRDGNEEKTSSNGRNIAGSALRVARHTLCISEVVVAGAVLTTCRLHLAKSRVGCQKHGLKFLLVMEEEVVVVINHRAQDLLMAL